MRTARRGRSRGRSVAACGYAYNVVYIRDYWAFFSLSSVRSAASSAKAR